MINTDIEFRVFHDGKKWVAAALDTTIDNTDPYQGIAIETADSPTAALFLVVHSLEEGAVGFVF